MKITTIGIDLAKTVFQIHGVDVQGKAVLRKCQRQLNFDPPGYLKRQFKIMPMNCFQYFLTNDLRSMI